MKLTTRHILTLSPGEKEMLWGILAEYNADPDPELLKDSDLSKVRHKYAEYALRVLDDGDQEPEGPPFHEGDEP